MGKRKISDQQGMDALLSLRQSATELPTAVRFVLQQLAELAPGGAVEVRVPPFGAVQCISGQDHRRGTPPNLVELDPETLFALVSGRLGWVQAQASGKLIASGTRANELAKLLPISKFAGI